MSVRDMGIKRFRQFPTELWIRAKLRFADGAFVVSRESTVAVRGGNEMRGCSHAWSLRWK
jgi:hypothetical protein